MSAENQPKGVPEQSLVVRRPIETEIASPHSRGLLREVRFSPQLPQRLMRLNDAFLIMAPRLQEVSISLIPGQTPMIDGNVSYVNGYRIDVKSNIDGDASLSIIGRGMERVKTEWAFDLSALQAFVTDIAPDREAHLRAMPHREEIGYLPLLDVSLADVAPNMIDDWNTPLPTRYPDDPEAEPEHLPYMRRSFEVHLEGQDIPLFQMSLSQYYKGKEVKRVFRAREFVFEGKAPAIEASMDRIIQHLIPPPAPNPNSSE